MQSMNNAKLLETIGKYTVHKYLEKLINTPMHKVTLCTSFPHTGAANISDTATFLIVDDLKKLECLNCGESAN